MAIFNSNNNPATREPTELQLARWEDDGGSQYIHAKIIFLNGKILSSRAAHIHQIISKYWEQLAEPKTFINFNPIRSFYLYLG